jgi:hypothetical protein
MTAEQIGNAMIAVAAWIAVGVTVAWVREAIRHAAEKWGR